MDNVAKERGEWREVYVDMWQQAYVGMERRCDELTNLLFDWLHDPRACRAIAGDCEQNDGCTCLYCRTKKAMEP